MSAWILWLVSLVLIAAEGALLGALGVTGWSIQVGLIVTCYLGMRRGFESSTWVLVALLMPLEWAAGGPMGTYSLGAVLLFLFLRLVAGQLEAKWSPWKALFCAIGVLIHHLLVAGYWLMTAPESPILSAVLGTMLSAAILSGGVSLPVGWMLARVEAQFDPRDGGQGLSFH